MPNCLRPYTYSPTNAAYTDYQVYGMQWCPTAISFYISASPFASNVPVSMHGMP